MSEPSIRLVDSDKVSAFDSFAFGNVVSGNISSPKLLFVEADGVGDCEFSEFGVSPILGNNGYLYAQTSKGVLLDLTAITLAALVETAGGSIASGTNLAYKIAAVDAFGHETTPHTAIVSPTFSTGATNRTELSWEEVAGAVIYRIYSSIASAGFFLVGETSDLAYTDFEGTNDGVTAPAGSGNDGYHFVTWGATTLDLGTIAEGDMTPVGVRINLGSLPSAAGNPQLFTVFASYSTIES